MMSGRLKTALKSVPPTKPSCTASVSHAVADGERFHSFAICGATAETPNQSAIPKRTADEISASARPRPMWATSLARRQLHHRELRHLVHHVAVLEAGVERLLQHRRGVVGAIGARVL